MVTLQTEADGWCTCSPGVHPQRDTVMANDRQLRQIARVAVGIATYRRPAGLRRLLLALNRLTVSMYSQAGMVDTKRFRITEHWKLHLSVQVSLTFLHTI